MPSLAAGDNVVDDIFLSLYLFYTRYLVTGDILQ